MLSNLRRKPGSLVLLALVLFPGVLTVPAVHSQALDPCTATNFVSSTLITSSSCVPFTGTFYNSATGEMVNVSGNLLVAASLLPPVPFHPPSPGSPMVTFTMLTTLLGSKVTATGASGTAYAVNGSNLKQILLPPSPIYPPVPFFPPNPCAPGNGLVPPSPIGQVPPSPIGGGHFGFVLYPPDPITPPGPIGGVPPNPFIPPSPFYLHLTLQLNNDCTINAAASTVAVDGDQLAGSDPGPATPGTP